MEQLKAYLLEVNDRLYECSLKGLKCDCAIKKKALARECEDLMELQKEILDSINQIKEVTYR